MLSDQVHANCHAGIALQVPGISMNFHAQDIVCCHVRFVKSSASSEGGQDQPGAVRRIVVKPTDGDVSDWAVEEDGDHQTQDKDERSVIQQVRWQQGRYVDHDIKGDEPDNIGLQNTMASNYAHATNAAAGR
jgi:hypothetical protein